MSGITLNKGSGSFYSATYRVDGKKRKWTTKTSSKSLAKEISKVWCGIEHQDYQKIDPQIVVDTLYEQLESKLPETGRDKLRALSNFQ